MTRKVTKRNTKKPQAGGMFNLFVLPMMLGKAILGQGLKKCKKKCPCKKK